MLNRRESWLSLLMTLVQIAITVLIFIFTERFFPKQVFTLNEKIILISQITLLWGAFIYKLHLGVIFRARSTFSMLSGYAVTVFFGSLFLLLELQLIPYLRHIDNSFRYLSIFFTVDLLALICFKLLLYYSMCYLRKKGYNSRNVIILADETSSSFITSFLKAEDWGYRLLAIISPDKVFKETYKKAHIISNQDTLRRYITLYPIDDVFYCLPLSDKRYNLEQMIYELNEIGVRLHIMQQFFKQKLNFNYTINPIFDHNFITHQTTSENYIGLKIKGIMDVLLSTFALFVSSPVIFLIAVSIKLQDGGSVFFKQERIGQNGRRFTCYKFRTMVSNAEELQAKLLKQNEADGPVFKIVNDPRITRLGHILRKTSLDELPQFLNVIKGDMSIVGPRPPLLKEVQQYKRHQLRRLSMKPGITCKWQVWGRHKVTFDEWMEMDLDYIDNWSLSLDIKIMFATASVIFKPNGQ
jgi:exopolysaccharide biosynthesis polyprenyl glycosylphosphotransferase